MRIFGVEILKQFSKELKEAEFNEKQITVFLNCLEPIVATIKAIHTEKTYCNDCGLIYIKNIVVKNNRTTCDKCDGKLVL